MVQVAAVFRVSVLQLMGNVETENWGMSKKINPIKSPKNATQDSWVLTIIKPENRTNQSTHKPLARTN